MAPTPEAVPSTVSLARRMMAVRHRTDTVGRVFVSRPRDATERSVVQLASLRDGLAAHGLGRVARGLAANGILGVEVRPFGEPGIPQDFPELARRLAADGIAVVTWLLPYHSSDPTTRTLAADLEQVLDVAAAQRVRYVGTASAPNRHGVGAEAVLRAAEDFSRFAAAAAERGIGFVYHHHVADFARDPATGERLFDLLLDASDPAVGIELDLHWAEAGARLYPGFDPLDAVRARPARFPLFHVRDGGADPALWSLDPRPAGEPLARTLRTATRALAARPSDIALAVG